MFRSVDIIQPFPNLFVFSELASEQSSCDSKD